MLMRRVGDRHLGLAMSAMRSISPPSTSSAGSPAETSEAGALSQATGRRRIDSPSLALDALTLFDTRDDFLQCSLYDYSTNDHLAQNGMQGFEAKDQIELADILEQSIEGLNKDLDEVQQGKRRLGRGGDQNEVECSVVSVGDLGRRIRRGRGASRRKQRRQREEVAGR